MCEPSDLAKWREVFLLLYYEKNRFMAYRNAAIREKAVIRNYAGCNVGYSEKIEKLEGKWDDRQCVGVMRFSNPTIAQRWLQSDHPFKQQDFLGQVDIIMIPLQKGDMTNKGYPIIEIANMHVNFKDIYETKYLPKLECEVQNHGGCPLIACHSEPWKWRGVNPLGCMYINQWPDWRSYEQFCASDAAKQLDSMRNTISDGYKITAELITDM